MRRMLALAVLAGLCGVGPALAQSYPQEMSIVVPKVEVRSGPSQKFYATSELYQNDRIIVVGECKDQPGWLEIKPPPGSFSWIDAKHVKQANPHIGVVQVESAPVLVGSSLLNRKPDVEKAPGFAAGYLVTVVDKPLVTDGVTWLPIQPHPKEVRYVPAEAVRPAQVASNSPANWAAPGGKQTVAPGHPAQAAVGNPGVRPVAGSTTSLSPSPQAPPAGATYAPQWTSYGVLRATTFTKDGQPMYVLVNRQEQPITYVTSKAGTSLRSYVGQTVAVYGQVVYRPDEAVRMHYVLASHVAVP